MSKFVDDVRAFHLVTDTPVLASPQIPNADRILLRKRLIDEEVNVELFTAMKENNIVEIADAIADSIYVLIGTALEYGIPLDAVWGEVQISNMAKVDLDTGKVRRREDGKVLKSEGWTKPDIRKALYG
jgi:predicted HAD superfamily Cof-like phosphohydrolase